MVGLDRNGYDIAENIFDECEVETILDELKRAGIEQKFGVRAFLSDHPNLQELVFTPNLKQLIADIAPTCNTCIKSIYFDKPPSANWIVNWHQDLTINLNTKVDIPGYKNWRVSNERTIVQPNPEFLESIFTIRIHLDDCKAANGALRVIRGSHIGGIIPIKEWMHTKEGQEDICEVRKGGVVLMKPLILHASRRTENDLPRRVLHLEFTDQDLPTGLEWKEAVAVE